MTDEEKKIHQKLAVDCFNAAWDLIDKPERTEDEDYEMILRAQASRYHWGKVGTKLEFQRGDWQISKVYHLLSHKEECLFAAKRCLEACEAEGFGGFDIAFAHEGMARACKLAGDMDGFRKHLAVALDKARLIEDEGDRSYALSEIEKNN